MPINQTSAEDFALLLDWLGTDRNQAGEKYEQIRQNLLDYFRRHGAIDPPGLADEVIVRVTSKVSKVAPQFVGDPAYYFLAVARNVLAESRRQPPMIELPEHLSVFSDQGTSEMKELRLQCLEQCWTTLSQQNQEILLRYCLGMPPQKLSDSREQMARELGVTLNGLRVMAHRLRNKLRRCIEKSIVKKEREIVPPVLHN